MLRKKGQNLFFETKRFTDKGTFLQAPLLSESESELWNPDDNEENWILTAGKIQNLRIAALKINGIEVEADQIFSFWKHIGNPNFGQGYVIGREIREGCIVPTIAGGLCQLSNALYDAALKANFIIVERHKHTRVIKGSLAEQDRDATVKWNFIDLRFKSDHSFRIEAELNADKLIVRFKSQHKRSEVPQKAPKAHLAHSHLNDCYSCGNLECFKHPQKATFVKKENEVTTFLLDERWPEYEEYISSKAGTKDVCLHPLSKSKWSLPSTTLLHSSKFSQLKHTFQWRWGLYAKKNAFALSLALDEKKALGIAKKIPLESTHLVVAQNLLPYLWKQGVLGGRTYDVLMTRLPMEKLHQRLDEAHVLYPSSPTLGDFRASPNWVELEKKALQKASRIITCHQEIADLFHNKSTHLNWQLPSATTVTRGTKLLFPASSVARKGAYEVKRLAKELDLTFVITGKAEEHSSFWEDLKVEYAAQNPFDTIGLVVYPTYIEHQPRLLLKAIAAGLPIITTTASGLPNSKQVNLILIGDYEALKRMVLNYLEKNH